VSWSPWAINSGGAPGWTESKGDDGIVVDHTIEQGNPADAPQLTPAVERVINRTVRKPAK
jgi:hypothetical protein